MNKSTCAALWSDGEIVIALAHVGAAYWAVQDDDDDDEDLIRTDADKANLFVIETTDGIHWFDDSRGVSVRAIGIDFMQAISLYWETRT